MMALVNKILMTMMIKMVLMCLRTEKKHYASIEANNGCSARTNADASIADTAGICITKAMNRPLTGGTVEAAAKPWLIPAGKYIASHRPQGQHPQ